MKQFKIALTTLLISSALLAKAGQGLDQPAADKASLGHKLSQVLDRAELQGHDLGMELELVLRVGKGGKLEVLDIAGDSEAVQELLRTRIEKAGMLVDASLFGKAYRFHFEPDGPNS